MNPIRPELLDAPDDTPTPTGRTLALVERICAPLAREQAEQRAILEGLVRDAQRAQGAALVVRALGGTAVAIALSLGGYALALARDAAVDHERVAQLRHDVGQLAGDQRETEADVGTLEADRAEMRATLGAVRESLQRIDQQLGEIRRELGGRGR